MKEEQTDEKFLVIRRDNTATYAVTGTEAVRAAGCPPWNCLYQSMAANALNNGDELELNENSSVIRLTGRMVTYG